MQMLDQALLAAVQAKDIDPDDAFSYVAEKRILQKYATDTGLMPRAEAPPAGG
jgi:twitching motility protein PilT